MAVIRVGPSIIRARGRSGERFKDLIPKGGFDATSMSYLFNNEKPSDRNQAVK